MLIPWLAFIMLGRPAWRVHSIPGGGVSAGGGGLWSM
jgi:hypothetical protein